jgi:hypothetical protein
MSIAESAWSVAVSLYTPIMILSTIVQLPATVRSTLVTTVALNIRNCTLVKKQTTQVQDQFDYDNTTDSVT